jgi:hypothetical protein
MVAVRTRFDGEKIEVPNELRGAAPGEVIVIFNATGQQSHSIWDVIGKSTQPKSAADLDEQVREERDSWQDR